MSMIYGGAAAAAFLVILLYVTDLKIKNILLNRYFLLIAAGLIVRVLALNIGPGFQTDVECFKSWASILYENGPAAFYSSEFYTDYPPGYMYILYALGFLRSFLELSDEAFTTLIKTPAIIFDIAAGVMILRLASKKLSGAVSLALSLLYILNPSVIINSSVWGQVDSVHTFVILLSLYLLTEDGYHESFALFALSVLIKPQALMFSPIYIFAAFKKASAAEKRSGGALYIARLAAVCCAVFFAGTLPFAKRFDFVPVLKQFVSTLASYPYATVNAYNLYALLGLNWFPVGFGGAGLPAAVIGLAALILIVAASFYLLKCDFTPGGVFFTAAFINITAFMFSIKMHERYVFPALALLAVAYIHKRDKRLLLLFAGFSVTLFVNCADILNVYSNNMDYGLIRESLPAVSAVNVFLTLFLIYAALSSRSGGSADTAPARREDNVAQKRFGKTDLIMLGSLTAVYSVIAFTNLGNLKSPQTFWRGDINSEVTADLTEIIEVKKFQYMVGARTDKKFELYSSETGEAWEFAGEFPADGVFSWKSADVDMTARYIKIISLSDELYLMEAAFRDESGKIVKTFPVSEAGAELFDESSLVPGAPDYMNSTYFDEIYHPRTAYEFVHGMRVYETTHPPLGKVIISLGIRAFGMTPFGWRFAGTLFGCLMVPLIYFFACRMFGGPWWAFFAATLFTFDFMHFAQTRLATIDTYATFFIIGMFYFMYRYYTMDFNRDGLMKTLVQLFFSGAFFGLAAASKWQGVYAAAGLAVILFYTLYLRYSERREGFAKKTAITLAACVVFFVAVPLAIYLLSYLPYLKTDGAEGLKTIIDNQIYMYNYHSKWVLGSTHYYSSKWWSWPFMLKPIYYYANTLPNGMKQGISSFGNPAVWWAGIAAFFYCVAAMYKKTDERKTIIFLLIAFAAQYLPWVLVDRTTYIYHFFPSVPFIVLMITYMFRERIFKKSRRLTIAYCAVAVLLFALFYPVLSGLPVSAGMVSAFLKWLPSWVLVG